MNLTRLGASKLFWILLSVFQIVCYMNCSDLSMHFRSLESKDSNKTLDTVLFQVTPVTEPDFVAPGRGANTFYTYNQAVEIPVIGETNWSLDNDTRFMWCDLETSQGVYDWTKFDSQIQHSIDRRQRFSFGIMPTATSSKLKSGSCTKEVDGARLNYPTDLHEAMQAESVPDWKYGDLWIPNWNSGIYLNRWEELLIAINKHIDETTYKGIAYRDVIYRIDARGYGNWGEWHTAPWRDCNCIPEGAKATETTLKSILDALVKAFPQHPLVLLVGIMGAAEIPEGVSYHALTIKNDWGPLGWRSDHMGSVRPFYAKLTYENVRVVNGVGLRDLVMNRWKTSPIVGEPMPDYDEVSDDGVKCPYYNLPTEISLFHHSQFSNFNSVAKGISCAEDNFRAASKLSGYRLILLDGQVSRTVDQGRHLTIVLNWQNVGVSPTYEQWDVQFELRNESDVAVWTGKSSMTLFRFLPSSEPLAVQDDFLIPNEMPPGTYRLHLVVRDPAGYRDPLPLAISGRKSDGSYFISDIFLL